MLTAIPLDGKTPARPLPAANVSAGPLCYDAATSTLLVRQPQRARHVFAVAASVCNEECDARMIPRFRRWGTRMAVLWRLMWQAGVEAGCAGRCSPPLSLFAACLSRRCRSS